MQVPYYSASALTEAKINAIAKALAIPSRFEKSSSAQIAKEIELRMVRLQYPYLDSSILGQYLALNAGKYNFLRMKKLLFKKQGGDASRTQALPS